MVSVSIAVLARRVHGEIRGNPDLMIGGAASLEKAKPGDLTFAVEEKNLRALGGSKAAACLIPRKQMDSAALANCQATLIIVDEPFDAFVEILQEFRPQRVRSKPGISPAAHISPTAQIGRDCNIHPGACIGDGAILGDGCEIYPGVVIGCDCRLGENCVLYPNVVLYAEVVLGKRVMIHASAVIGADGFGYRFRDGRFHKVPQLGSVVIGDDCEIGACTTIDRGMIDPTLIGEGTKLDNLIMIAHNCEIGKHNAYASQVGFAGSVTTGDFVRIAGQAGIRDHVHLGTGCVLGAKSGVHKDVPPGETHVGYPAGPESEQVRIHMSLPKVPELRKRVRELESRLEELTVQLQGLTAQRKAS